MGPQNPQNKEKHVLNTCNPSTRDKTGAALDLSWKLTGSIAYVAKFQGNEKIPANPLLGSPS